MSDVRIFHPELGLTSEVTEEAAPTWVGHGWTRLEDGNEAAVSEVAPDESADEPSTEEN